MKLTKEEEHLIKTLRHKYGQHGVRYERNHLIFTDGVATTHISSEDDYLIDAFAKLVNWEDDDLINYFRKRDTEQLKKMSRESIESSMEFRRRAQKRD